jgi:hypothetical protein
MGSASGEEKASEMRKPQESQGSQGAVNNGAGDPKLLKERKTLKSRRGCGQPVNGKRGIGLERGTAL